MLNKIIFIATFCISFTNFGQNSKWTILVYMNADNDLERFGIKDFIEMSKVDNSKDVNIVVQMDRSPGYSDEYGDWTQTLRFKIEKNILPIKHSAIEDLGEKNMGDPTVLKDFIDWGKEKYPAENYALIIWDHGDGWRYSKMTSLDLKIKKLYFDDYKNAMFDVQKNQVLNSENLIKHFQQEMVRLDKKNDSLISEINLLSSKIESFPVVLKAKLTSNSKPLYVQTLLKDYIVKFVDKLPNEQLSIVDKYSLSLSNLISTNIDYQNIKYKIEKGKLITSIDTISFDDFKIGSFEANPVKAVSHDNTNKDVLFNKEIHDNLKDKEIQIIGFDACLMSMIETAHTLKNKANYLVGSEELEPGNGWNYTLWLNDLVLNPYMTDTELSKNIVKSYSEHYKNQDEVTLSAIDLSLISKLSISINELSINLINEIDKERLNIYKAREKCQKYAVGVSSIHSIDLYLFLHHLSNLTKNQRIVNSCNQIKTLINLCVVANFYSNDRQFESDIISYGSFGLAIYFPSRIEYFDKAYTDLNSYYPVEFVRDIKWDNFLQLYLKN